MSDAVGRPGHSVVVDGIGPVRIIRPGRHHPVVVECGHRRSVRAVVHFVGGIGLTRHVCVKDIVGAVREGRSSTLACRCCRSPSSASRPRRLPAVRREGGAGHAGIVDLRRPVRIVGPGRRHPVAVGGARRLAIRSIVDGVGRIRLPGHAVVFDRMRAVRIVGPGRHHSVVVERGRKLAVRTVVRLVVGVGFTGHARVKDVVGAVRQIGTGRGHAIAVRRADRFAVRPVVDRVGGVILATDARIGNRVGAVRVVGPGFRQASLNDALVGLLSDPYQVV